MKRIQSALSAFAIGAAVGVLAAALEAWALGQPPRRPAFAAYALGGGLVCAAIRLAAGAALGAAAARRAALLACGLFAWLDVVYFVNVRALPSEHFLSAKSLGVDAVVSLSLLAALAWVSRRVRAAGVQARGGLVSASAGALALVAAAWTIAHALAPAPAPAEEPRAGTSVLLIVLDSARRDHLGLYGQRLATSPGLDRLAADSRVFRQAYAYSSWTVPSVQAMLHTDAETREGIAPVAAELARRGYATACFTDNPHLTRDSDVLRGFQQVVRSSGRWRTLLHGTVVGGMLDRLDPGDDDRLVDAALAWAAARRGPYFLYVHLMDAHTPYRKAPIDGRRRRGRHIQFPRSGMPITAEEAEDVRARYAGGVRSAAEQAARVVSTLASGPRPVLAVVTADHGESLGEEGRWFHNYTLAGELLAVPLLVHGEGVQPGAVEPGVGHASVGKTLLAAAGVDTGALAGSDLRTSDGEAAVEGALPSDLSYRIVDGYKVVMDHRRQTAALFDLRADPEERRDLAGARPEMVRLVAAARLRPAPPAVSAGDLERLKAFGYGSPAALRGPGPPAGGR